MGKASVSRLITIVAAVICVLGVFSTSTVHAKGKRNRAVPKAEPVDPVVVEAKSRFEHAVELVNAGDYNAAIAEFEASYALVPRPSILYNLGLVYERLFRYDEAIEYYRRYLRLAPEDDEDRESVLQAIARFEERFGTLTIEADVPADVWLDGRHVGKAPGVYYVPEGSHTLELRSSQHGRMRRQVEIAAQRSHKFFIELKEPEQKESGISPVWFWTCAGATVATAAVGAYFGLRAVSLNNDVKESDPLLSDTQSLQDDRDQAALYADIFLISSGVLGISTLVLALLTDWDNKEEPKPEDTVEQVRLAPFLTPSMAGLMLQGRL